MLNLASWITIHQFPVVIYKVELISQRINCVSNIINLFIHPQARRCQTNRIVPPGMLAHSEEAVIEAVEVTSRLRATRLQGQEDQADRIGFCNRWSPWTKDTP